jgi:GAF domain-containing protein
MRDGVPIGAILIRRMEVRPFSDKQVALLKTFADQAAIAVENVRLFNETKEALERQTASADVLRVIGSSPSDLQPVFDAILENAMRLCEASLATVGLYDGKLYRHVAQRGGSPEYVKFLFGGPFEPNPRYTLGRMIAERRPFHTPDYRELPAYKEGNARSVATVELGGTRTYLAVPMVKDGQVVGGITVRRTEVRPFTQKQIDLVKTFADQAVIAIENARLFNETKEALERQTATAEILKVISASPTATQPVFDSIVKKCHALFEGSRVALWLISDGQLFPRSTTGFAAEPMPIDRESAMGACVLEARTIHLPDLEAAAGQYPRIKQLGLKWGYRSGMYAPLLREGRAIGGISVLRPKFGAFSDKEVALLTTFADQAVIAIENARLFNETKEALEQQTAISEVLRVISDSPTDVKPVLDAVAARAAKICDASDARIWLVEGDSARHAAGFGDVPMPVALGGTLPLAPSWVSGRAILERATVHIEDAGSVASEDYPVTRELQARSGFRTILAVPLMREGRALGAIMLRRLEVRRFSDKQVALLGTFADQAAIAIENVRLFNETKEALERQTATADILRVISSSPTDARPVFDVIAKSGLRLFGGLNVAILLRREKEFILAGYSGPGMEDLPEQIRTAPLDPEKNFPSRAILEGKVLNVTDWKGADVPEHERVVAQSFGIKSGLMVPLLRQGEGIGAIAVMRATEEPFTDKDIALLRSFADQAVIAIENVRLFRELQERTEALTKSVDQLTALGEVGQAISSTLDLEIVLKTIVSRAVQLAGLDGGSIYEFDELDGRFHLRAAEHVEEQILEVSRRSPIRLGEGAVGRAGAMREPVVVEDVLDESYKSRVRDLLIKSGSRALLAVPLLREDHLLGALVVSRKSPGPFAPEVIDLLKTFATQSAVAIQNARLFREIAEKSRQLEEASRHKSQFLASMSHELRTPLNAILGFNEMILGQVYGEVPLDMKEPLEDIQKSGKHLLRLINNVLDLAKIEAGKMELALADYSVQDTVESVRSTLRPLAEAKGLELVARVPDDIPLAYGDGGRLAQCLMNLAGNSLKFTKQGRVEIAVDAQNGLLRWRVSDTGIGIPPEKIETLFSEFKQTDATIASEYGGTGLGLSITKKFVEMHGGRISVESEPGKGSAFTIEIPLRVKAPA